MTNTEEIKGEMYMYEHQSPGITGLIYCETCKEAVEIGSPCTASKYYPRWQELKKLIDSFGF
jgi:hypothetical protein